LFFSCGWGGWSGILSLGLTWLYVGWDGMRMGKYVGSWIVAVCNKGLVASNFCRRFSDKVSLCVGVVLLNWHTTLVALGLFAFLVWVVF